MKDKFVVGPSPHIRSPRDINYIMWDVVVALIPVMLASIIFYGMAAVYILFVSTFTALFFEAIVLHKKISIRKFFGDGSAAITGILLGLSLPPVIGRELEYLWLAALGSAVAILIGKHVFGGLGKNPFNPALVGRAFLVASFSEVMAAKWITPGVDAVTAATALAPGAPDYSLFDMFIGNIPGSLGETSALAILIGGFYLLAKGHIDWRIPGGFLGAMGVYSIFYVAISQGFTPNFIQLAVNEVLFQWFSGTALLAAIYMATCYVTSPTTKKGRLYYGIGCGLILILIRYHGQLPEGATFAILFMNALTPLLDKYTIPQTFGEVKK
ncbi:RnfABCDGE type electron transport complex subunit D [Anaerobranca gottschalkii]|uniref:Ion-translocating oxidoreductase complex subunit D n=1 Tax=Anaerobranca gottschalkii DSM 13577 TaxID=1120990 RepID=A0A1H9YAW9_9FIRM|nr:RnfABCDGE type electron transport complex subunit D [Anaerobranca gottschalkii]SES65602.1 electron transport complex protein RnfD [Anaerobranca gottschalkii DSM 13577]